MTMQLRDDVTVASTDYGLVLLDESGGEYWNLNPTGALVIRSVSGGATPEQAARALADEHPVDLATARADVDELLGSLLTAGLVETGETVAR